MTVYYNDNDHHVCAWARELISAGLVPAGQVDERSIRDIRPEDLNGKTQVHLFCGILGWPYALGLAGWPSGRPVWTGSCPCPPFSAAGRKRCKQCRGKLGFYGVDDFGCENCDIRDSRHLWPEMRRLIGECKPTTVFGEQVASADGRVWMLKVRVDLEALGYAVGIADLCASAVGAPHIRQRLFWGASLQGEPGSMTQPTLQVGSRQLLLFE